MKEHIDVVNGESTTEVLVQKPKKKRSRGRDGIFSRNGHYYISYIDAQGIRKQRKTDAPTLEQARAIRAKELEKAEKRRVFEYNEPSQDSFADVITRYLEFQKSRITPAAYIRTKGIIEQHLKAALGPMQLCHIRRKHVQQYITDRLAEEVKGGTVLRELNVLRHLFTWAIFEAEILPPDMPNPCARIRVKVEPPRNNYLKEDELGKLLGASPTWLRPVIGLLVSTGMRRGEALGLRWSYVDFGNGIINLPKTKNNDGRVVYLNDLSLLVLRCRESECQGGKPGGYVFDDPHITPANVSLACLRASRKAGIEDFRLHDLRHTTASWMRMRGADLQDVADQLGHRDLRMTRRYANLSPDHLSTAAKRLDSVFKSDFQQFQLQAPAQA